MDDNTEQIAELLLQTRSAHHAAFLDVDGHDPDWPAWYAEYLQERLPSLLDRELTLRDLSTLMIELNRSHQTEEPNTPWQSYYARRLVEL
jgi:hypothetical protein